MTARELYLYAKAALTKAGVDTPAFDAALLAQHFLGLDRPALAVRGHEAPEPRKEAEFLKALSQRERRRPLQYIIGQWPFMSLTLRVGEGVLVPREDTAVLVEAAAGLLGPAPRGLDLCAGTGAVALGLCSLVPAAQVTCVEIDRTALTFLEANLAKYSGYNCCSRPADVLAGPDGSFGPGLDFIVSNPPYISSREIPFLQPEVLCEPVLALDGGGDGLEFYRAILGKWAPLLRSGGILAVEIGESQGHDVEDLFELAGFEGICRHKDIGGLDRVVVALKK